MMDIMDNHVVWLLINDPASILHIEAARLVLKVVKLKIWTFLEDVNCISI